MARKNRSGIFSAAAELMELPAEVAAGASSVEIVGKGELRMENHRGVLSYSEEEITVSGGRVLVRIVGEKLKISAMDPLSLLVTGTINRVELE